MRRIVELAGCLSALLCSCNSDSLYTPLPAPWSKVSFDLEGRPPPDAAALSAAMTTAVAALEGHTDLDVRRAISMNDGTLIFVRRSESWRSASGEMVGGEFLYEPLEIVIVGPMLSSLCHELAHEAQWRLSRTTGHDRWEELGISSADREYRSWVASGSASATAP